MLEYLPQLLDETEYISLISEYSKEEIKKIRISSVCCDSRKAACDSVFVCLKGANFDGHSYASQAYSLGCRVFVVEKQIILPKGAVLILVKDSRLALASLAASFYSHPEKKLTVIGITGTKGKTTSALILYNLLKMSSVKCAYIGTNGVIFNDKAYETKNSTPESIDLFKYMHDMYTEGITHLVMEVSSQSVFMKRIHGIRFKICVFTNLSPDHIDKNEHPSFEHYRDCKKSMLCDYGAETLIYNKDDKYSEYMISGFRGKAISFSCEQNADWQASGINHIRKDKKLFTSFDCKGKIKKDNILISLPGKFNVYNTLSALAVADELGIDVLNVLHSLKNLSVKGRYEMVDCTSDATVIIDYAHNKVSLEAILHSLRQYSPEKIICVFGSVGERTKMRRAELGKVSATLADVSIITSDNPNHEPPENIINEIASEVQKYTDSFYTEPDRKKAITLALDLANEGDIILLAGKGQENHQLIDGKYLPFSEKEIVLEYCRSKEAIPN